MEGKGRRMGGKKGGRERRRQGRKKRRKEWGGLNNGRAGNGLEGVGGWKSPTVAQAQDRGLSMAWEGEWGKGAELTNTLAFSRPSRPHRASWKHFCISGIFGNVYETERFMSRNRD